MKHHAKTSRRAFTLTEALVAVIAIAIISVGLAAIFASVGDTVQRGRRISAINQYAASIERRIRADLNGITRDGFLVIRNEYAGGANADADEQLIPLSPEATSTARLRRVDELMFFARGSFVSARGAVAAGADVPRSREARIYYGHGQQQLEGADGFFRPYLDDPNADPELGLGIRGDAVSAIGEANPNVYAGDWTLLRHATLLKAPAISFDTGDLSPEDFQRASDNGLQINQQVAAGSIFRSLAFWGEPVNTSNAYEDDFVDYSVRAADAPPIFSSGVVDIATDTLPEIRRQVMGLGYGFDANPLTSPGGSSSNDQIWAETPASRFADEGAWAPRVRFGGTPTTPSLLYATQIDRHLASMPDTFVAPEARQSLVHLQQAWMADALPAASNELTYLSPQTDSTELPPILSVYRGLQLQGDEPAVFDDVFSPLYDIRSRMRYENTPPGYNADVFGPDALAAFESDDYYGPILLAAARADQQMVTSSQFIPRCTEFIVEWSFGERYTAGDNGTTVDATWDGNAADIEGELIWYGLPRPAADGVPIASIRPRRYLDATPDALDTPIAIPTVANPLSTEEQRLLERHLRAELIQGDPDDLDPDRQPPGNSLTGQRQRVPNPGVAGNVIGGGIDNSAAVAPTSFYFGYADPRAVPVDDFAGIENTGFDLNGDGYRDDLDGDGVYDDAWPWPRLIRITMSFADPVDQTVEDTFQFVVELPRNGDL